MSYRRIATIAALVLLIGCGGSTKQEDPKEPQGTIIGNPTPPQGTLKIAVPDGRGRYIVNIYEKGRSEVIALDPSGNVTGKAQGSFVLTRNPEATAQQTLEVETEVSADLRRFDMTVTFSDGGTLIVSLFADENNRITATSVAINSSQVVAEVEFTDATGSTRSVTVIVNDRPARVCASSGGQSVPAAEGAYTEGLALLASGLIPAANASFREAVDLDPGHAEAHFGAGFTAMLLLAEMEGGIALLDGLGQPRFTSDDLFGPGSYFAERNDVSRGVRTDPPSTTRFPYGNCLAGPDSYCRFGLGRMLALARDGFTAEQVQGAISSIKTEVSTIIDHFESARRCTGFQFTIPGRLFFSTTDVEINRSDLAFVTASQYATLFGLSLANTWRFDIDLGSIYNAEGRREISDSELIVSMNLFFRIRSLEELAEGREALLNFLVRTIEGLSETPNAPGFGIIEQVPATTGALDHLADLAEAFSASLGGMTGVPGTSPLISVNFSSLFSDPPDLDDIGIDPFVMDDSGDIQVVEAFFQGLLNRFVMGIDLEEGTPDDYEILITDLFNQPLVDALFDEVSEMNIGEGIAP